MGSQSDFKTMIFCEKVLKKLDIKFETKIISAHRTPRQDVRILPKMLKKIILELL